MSPDRPPHEPTVFIVDDDPDIREALDALLRSVGLRVEAFASVEEYVASGALDQPGVLLLDVRLTGQSGIAFQAELGRRGIATPIVFMSGHADVPTAVRAMKGGAIEFLTKPVRPQDLIDAVHLGLARDEERRIAAARADLLGRAWSTLTERERDVADLVAAGHSNKTTAAALGIAEATVKVHRAALMKKLGAASLAELVELIAELRPHH